MSLELKLQVKSYVAFDFEFTVVVEEEAPMDIMKCNKLDMGMYYYKIEQLAE